MRRRKDLEQLLKISMKEVKKAYGLKSREQFLFQKKDDYFMTIIVIVSGRKNEQIKVLGEIKPYAFDDIFWQVFHMPGNCDAPMSLRAAGAFQFQGLVLFWENAGYNCEEDFPVVATSLLHKCYTQLADTIEKLKSVDDFLVLAKETVNPGLFDHNLAHMISLIADRKYEEAKMIAEELQIQGSHGMYQNEGKYIYEHVINYCDEHLSKEPLFE